MAEVHKNSDGVQAAGTKQPLLEADLTPENINELSMIRQEMLDACKGGGIFQLSSLEKKIDAKKIF